MLDRLRQMEPFELAAQPDFRRASLTQETVDILRLGKVFGSIEPDWVYEPR